MVQMRERGDRQRQIAQRFGVSVNAVHYHCVQRGVEPPAPPRLRPEFWRSGPIAMRNGRTVRAFTPAEDAKLVALRMQDLSYVAIGGALGRDPSSVRARLIALARREERGEA